MQKLNNNHNKTKFNCGNKLLDNYIKNLAKQDVKRDLSVCYVLYDLENIVAGYYTLSSNSIKRDIFPEEMRRKLPSNYNDLPTILLGRLAIDKKFQGNVYGEYLLLDALHNCIKISTNMGALAVVVDPKDEKARNFYLKYGFILLPETKKMFIPLKTIEAIIEKT